MCVHRLVSLPDFSLNLHPVFAGGKRRVLIVTVPDPSVPRCVRCSGSFSIPVGERNGVFWQKESPSHQLIQVSVKLSQVGAPARWVPVNGSEGLVE